MQIVTLATHLDDFLGVALHLCNALQHALHVTVLLGQGLMKAADLGLVLLFFLLALLSVLVVLASQLVL